MTHIVEMFRPTTDKQMFCLSALKIPLKLITDRGVDHKLYWSPVIFASPQK